MSCPANKKYGTSFFLVATLAAAPPFFGKKGVVKLDTERILEELSRLPITVEELQAWSPVYQVPKESLVIILPPSYFIMEELFGNHSCFLCKDGSVLASFEMEPGDSNPLIAQMIQRIAWWSLLNHCAN